MKKVGQLFSFIILFIGAFYLAFIRFPIDRLIFRGDKYSARKLLREYSSIWVEIIKKLSLIDINVEGSFNYPAVYASNHPTIFDAIILISLLDNTCCIAKPSLRVHPIFGRIIKYCDYLINTNSRELIDSAKIEVSRGAKILIFPEGTRTDGDRLIKLKRGAAMISLESSVPLIPIRITCTPVVFSKSSEWFTNHKPKFTIKFEDPLDMSDSNDSVWVRARELTRGLENFYNFPSCYKRKLNSL